MTTMNRWVLWAMAEAEDEARRRWRGSSLRRALGLLAWARAMPGNAKAK
jgi:hypothetical protein